MSARPRPQALPSAFFRQDAEAVARGLLGCVLVADVVAPGGRPRPVRRRARIVETEAYVGPQDLAAHSSRGRTKRTEVMFGPAGRAYVYFVYGMHHMLNVVARGHAGHAVLLRAAEPLDGWDADLRGPGRLAKAFGIGMHHYGHDLRVAPLYLARGPPPARILATPRIGVDYARAWADAPLRFIDADSAHLSRPLRASPSQGPLLRRASAPPRPAGPPPRRERGA